MERNEVVDHVIRTETEIQYIWNLNLEAFPQLILARDLLVFGCYTGLRYSDIHSLQPYHFKKVIVGSDTHTAIQKNQKKVNEKVHIALIHLAKIVAEKYKYDLPKMHMNDFNEKIKKIAEIAGLDEYIPISHKHGKTIEEEVYKKYELMSSHICRRSFATYVSKRS
ncbi:MAG: hypothetical protein M3Z26_06300 [Bacteroidota bacterium]|nr:hypothetical protein [Bacteroidota bacterium]